MNRTLQFICISILALNVASCTLFCMDNNPDSHSMTLSGQLEVSVNGSPRLFDKVRAARNPQSGNITVTAITDRERNEVLSFTLQDGNTNPDAASFTYKINNNTYIPLTNNNDNYTVSSILLTNSNSVLQGSFSGKLARLNELQEIDSVIVQYGRYDLTVVNE